MRKYLGWLFIGALALLTAVSYARASDAEFALRGVFCNEEQDILDVYADIRAGLSLEQSITVRNADKVKCVYANEIKYVVTRPVAIGQVGAFGIKFVRFRATLVGVEIGGKKKPVDPLPTFFARFAGDLESVEERES